MNKSTSTDIRLADLRRRMRVLALEIESMMNDPEMHDIESWEMDGLETASTALIRAVKQIGRSLSVSQRG